MTVASLDATCVQLKSRWIHVACSNIQLRLGFLKAWGWGYTLQCAKLLVSAHWERIQPQGEWSQTNDSHQSHSELIACEFAVSHPRRRKQRTSEMWKGFQERNIDWPAAHPVDFGNWIDTKIIFFGTGHFFNISQSELLKSPQTPCILTWPKLRVTHWSRGYVCCAISSWSTKSHVLFVWGEALPVSRGCSFCVWASSLCQMFPVIVN